MPRPYALPRTPNDVVPTAPRSILLMACAVVLVAHGAAAAVAHGAATAVRDSSNKATTTTMGCGTTAHPRNNATGGCLGDVGRRYVCSSNAEYWRRGMEAKRSWTQRWSRHFAAQGVAGVDLYRYFNAEFRANRSFHVAFVGRPRQTVAWTQRCDGVPDCAYETDEYLCDDEETSPTSTVVADDGPPPPQTPLSPAAAAGLRNAHLHRRAMSAQFAMSRCIECNCDFGPPIQITRTMPIFRACVTAQPTLALQQSVPRGLGCDGFRTDTVSMQYFKKTTTCLKAICCAKQDSCDVCTTGLFSPTYKCQDCVALGPSACV